MSSIESRIVRCKNGDMVTLRSPQSEDASVLIRYAKTVLTQSPFFCMEVDEFEQTEMQERNWIEKHLASPGCVLIAAEVEGELIGLLNFACGIRRRLAHEGSLGVSLLQQHRGKGIGSAMMQTLIDWARNNPNIEKLALEVFATNTRAIDLYRKLGFVEEGRRVNAVKLGVRNYADIILMACFV